MRYIFTILLISFCVLATFAQHILKGKVVRVADGDTITVLDSTNT